MISGQTINRDRLAFALCGDEWEGLGKSFSKRLKKKVSRAVESVKDTGTRVGKATHRIAYEAAPYAGRVVAYTAPVVGAIVGGPAGAAAGTAVASLVGGASRHGSREDKFRTARRFAAYGAGITAATGLTSLITGGGITQGLIPMGQKALMPTAAGVPAESATDWGQAFGTDFGTPSSQSGGGGGGGGGIFSDIFGGAGRAAERFYEHRMNAARENVSEGITAPFDINAPGGAGGSSGAPGGGAGGAAPGKPLETQHLIMGGLVLAGALFLLKR